MFSTVVLPAPFGPITLVISPGFATKLTSFAAVMPPKEIPMPLTTSSARAEAAARNGFTSAAEPR